MKKPVFVKLFLIIFFKRVNCVRKVVACELHYFFVFKHTIGDITKHDLFFLSVFFKKLYYKMLFHTFHKKNITVGIC